MYQNVCMTWCGTNSSYPLVEPVAQQAIETIAELGRESSAERSCRKNKRFYEHGKKTYGKQQQNIVIILNYVITGV